PHTSPLTLRDVLAMPGGPTLGGAWGTGHDVWLVARAFDPHGNAEAPSDGLVVHSADDGRTWSVTRRGRPSLDAIWGTGDVLVAVGATILRSTDLGATWQVIDRSTIAGGAEFFEGWRFFSAVSGRGNDVWAVACTYGGFMTPSVIVHSGDAGKTWALQHGPIAGCPGKAMWTPGPPDVFAIGDFVDENGTFPLIVASHDNGKTWRRTTLADGFGIRAIG